MTDLLIQASKKIKTGDRSNLDLIRESPAYQMRLSLYPLPPTSEITLEEMESFALDRLRVLKELDKRKDDDSIESVLKTFLPLPSMSEYDYKIDTIDNAARASIPSYVLTRSGEREWFINSEKELLRLRLKIAHRDDPKAIVDFCNQNNLKFTRVPTEEYSNKWGDIKKSDQSCGRIRGYPFDYATEGNRCYKVPFLQAENLVSNRQVLVSKGFAYVYEEDLIPLICTQFKVLLTAALERAFRAFSTLSDERVSSMTTAIPKHYFQSEYDAKVSSRNRKIQLQDLDELARRSFPMCMKNMHNQLRKNHHLKHDARMQYGLFLKGIGLTMEQSIEFWHNEIVQHYGEEGWKKRGYTYNIKHNYGQEGKRQNYTPYNCHSIISKGGYPEDDHGCPFARMPGKELAVKLREDGLDMKQIDEIEGYIREGQFQESCKAHYKFKHPNAKEYYEVQDHPNRYFDESERYFESLNKPKTTVVSDNDAMEV